MYPTELDANGMVRCEMPGVIPSDGTFSSPSPAEEMAVETMRWGVSTIDGFTSAQEACCRCGSDRGGRSDRGGYYVRDPGVEKLAHKQPGSLLVSSRSFLDRLLVVIAVPVQESNSRQPSSRCLLVDARTAIRL